MYSIPLDKKVSVSYDLKLTDKCIEQIEKNNKYMGSYGFSLSYNNSWVAGWSSGGAHFNLSADKCNLNFWQVNDDFSYEKISYFSEYLACMFPDIRIEDGSWGGISLKTYSDFAQVVNGMNGNPFERTPHFEIKIIVEDDEEILFESVTSVILDNITIPASDVELDGSIVF